VVPIIEKLQAMYEETPFLPNEVKAVVITPTRYQISLSSHNSRELAQQIQQVFAPFLEDLGGKFSSLLLIGGTELQDDVFLFNKNGAHIVIATPGRLNHMMQTVQSFNVRKLEVLVFDEADRLLDMGFNETVHSILERFPKQRRTGLFSATQTQQVEELMKAGLRNPKKVTVTVERKGDSKDVQNIPST
jgi:ATP-dependent RNA helicase DDX55/SPB4